MLTRDLSDRAIMLVSLVNREVCKLPNMAKKVDALLAIANNRSNYFKLAEWLEIKNYYNQALASLMEEDPDSAFVRIYKDITVALNELFKRQFDC